MLQVGEPMVERTTLRPLILSMNQALGPQGNCPWILSTGLFHRTRRLHGLQYCPECLKGEAIFFRRAWRLAFVTACDEHNMVLRDACPHCDAPITPHRAPAGNVRRCHACFRDLCSFQSLADVEAPHALEAGIQRILSRACSLETSIIDGQRWRRNELFSVLRTLISLASASQVRVALGVSFGVDLRWVTQDAKLVFECARVAARVDLLRIASAWFADWPRNFRIGAAAAHLSQQSFARRQLAGELSKEVSSLPIGVRRHRKTEASIHDDALMRLRRADQFAYRSQRAQKLLAAARRTTR